LAPLRFSLTRGLAWVLFLNLHQVLFLLVSHFNSILETAHPRLRVSKLCAACVCICPLLAGAAIVSVLFTGFAYEPHLAASPSCLIYSEATI
jgi:hypothetical protein